LSVYFTFPCLNYEDLSVVSNNRNLTVAQHGFFSIYNLIA
jgi:hypothetical protein